MQAMHLQLVVLREYGIVRHLVFFVSQRVNLPIKLAIQIMLEIKSIRSTVVKLANFTVDSIIFIGPFPFHCYLPTTILLSGPSEKQLIKPEWPQ